MSDEILKFIPEQFWNEEFRFLKLRPKGKEPTVDSGGWQKKNYKWNDQEFMNHIANGGNYGIIGGYGNLVLIDSDSKQVDELCKKLPETFTIKTGSPEEYKNHYFFILEKRIKPIRLTENKLGDLGDVRSVGQYVVGANSIHPKGGTYKVIKDIPITHIKESVIRNLFSEFIEKGNPIEFQEYDVNTTIRKTPYIRECRVPDYLANNELPKGNTAKNWKLFRYIADILRNRQSRTEAYQAIVRKQKHSDGAIKGWAMKANEGKLSKSSCKLMKEYIRKYYPDLENDICGGCPLNRVNEEKQKIEANPNYDDLQKNVMTAIAVKDEDKASEFIVEDIKKNNDIYTTIDDIKSEIWFYKEGIYIPNGKSRIQDITRRILGQMYTAQRVNKVIVKIEADTQIEHDDFFKNNYINEIPIKNGILNIFTRELLDFTPEKIFFNKLPIIYDEAAECENINKFFSDVLRDSEDTKVMMELIGFCLLKEYRFEKSAMFLGNGRNGKGKTLSLMKHFLGPENCSSIPLSQITAASTSVWELHGRLANLAGDLSNTDLKDTGMFKQITGRDFITAKRKYLNDLFFENYAKIMFACNELPKVYDLSDGFWSRWILFEFPYRFCKKSEYDKIEDKTFAKVMDESIIDKITTPEELSGLLNEALDGLDRLIENKGFSYSKGTNEVKDIWIRKSDSFASFCIDFIEEDYSGKVTKKDLRKKYNRYCKSLKLPGCGDKAIKATLEDRFGAVESQEYGGDRYWEGIKFGEITGKTGYSQKA